RRQFLDRVSLQSERERDARRLPRRARRARGPAGPRRRDRRGWMLGRMDDVTVRARPGIDGGSSMLAALRRAAGQSQAGMAEAVGVARSTWAMVESGARAPSLDVAMKAASVLGERGGVRLSAADLVVAWIGDAQTGAQRRAL